MSHARRATNIHPSARRSLLALSGEIDRDELSLRMQLQAAERLARGARRRGQSLTLESALADIAAAQIQRQRNQAESRRKR